MRLSKRGEGQKKKKGYQWPQDRASECKRGGPILRVGGGLGQEGGVLLQRERGFKSRRREFQHLVTA